MFTSVYRKAGTVRGFTLIELLVVISIIGMLSSVVLASLNAARAKGRDSSRVQSLVQLRTALELYRSTVGTYPKPSSAEVSIYKLGVNQPNVNIRSYCGLTPDNTIIPGLTPQYISTLPKASNANACFTYASDGTDYYLKYSNTESICSSPSSGQTMCDFGGTGAYAGTYLDGYIHGTIAIDASTNSISVKTSGADGWYND